MTDLISKKALIEAVKQAWETNTLAYLTEAIDLINSAPVVNSIEHDAPSAPIEAQLSYTDGLEEAVRACDSLQNEVERGCLQSNNMARMCATKIRDLIPSTQAPKESEG